MQPMVYQQRYMVDKGYMLIELIKSELNFPEFFPSQCINHREHLVTIYFK